MDRDGRGISQRVSGQGDLVIFILGRTGGAWRYRVDGGDGKVGSKRNGMRVVVREWGKGVYVLRSNNEE